MASMLEHFKIDVTKGFANPSCIFKGKTYRITVLSDFLVRLEYNPKGIFNDYPTIFALNRKFESLPNFVVKQDDKFLNITNDNFVLEYIKEKPFFASKLVPDSNLRVTIKDTDKIWYYNNPEVKNYKGTAGSFGDSKDIKLDNGLYNVDGFATIDDSNRPVFVADGRVMKNPSDGIDLYLFAYKNNFSGALKSYYILTGYPSLIPRYALGIWWNKEENYNDEGLYDLLDNFKKHEIPLSTIMLGDKYKKVSKKEIAPNFEFDNDKFKNISKTISDLHKDNVFLGINLKIGNGITPKDKYFSVFKELLKQAKDKTLPINVYDSNILTAFYKYIIANFESVGVDYFWLDDKTDDNIMNFMLLHYTFMNYLKSQTRRALVVSKNPRISTHRYSVLYSGETEVSWKTLKYLPSYNLTSANIGLSWWSHDIGGFKGGIEDAELYTRYVQFGVYSPIFRFAAKEGKYYKREPWKWDVKTEKIVRDYTRLRHKLIPYIYSEAYKYHKEGSPLIKPLYYKYPDIYFEPLYKNEYHFGSQLCVCPITESKDTIMNRVVKKVYIPEGTWYDFKTGYKYPGNKRYVTFYKDEDYPVFAKSGAIIPLAVLDDANLNNINPPKKLEIQVFPGESNSYNLYEDDGFTNLYKEGYYIITNIDYNYRQNNYTLIIRPIEGRTKVIPDTRDYIIRFKNTRSAENVKVNIGRLETTYITHEDDKDFIIEVRDVPTNQQLTVNCFGKAIEVDAVRLINEDIDSIISDLQIETRLKEKISEILFSDKSIRKKRIEIRKLRVSGLNKLFIKMFIKLLEYINEI